MTKLLLASYIILTFIAVPLSAQDVDSTLNNLKNIPTKYINEVDKKIEQYSNRIENKTEKTLTRLSRWENKIKTLLQKANPEAAERLFGNGQLTFTSALQKLKEGEAIALQYHASYDKYRDELATSLKYLGEQKEHFDSSVLKKIRETSISMKTLSAEEDRSEALQQFIKERKKQLIGQSIQYIGNSKYLGKIDKEAYYYAETLKNYKELFSDSKKAEETAMAILSRIPAFKEFVKQNSMLAGLFDISPQGAQIVPGMQTRASVQQLIQGRISSMGSNGRDIMSSNLQSAQGLLSDIKTKLNSGSSSGEMPDFKPNNQKTKIFRQRIEYGANIQFSRSNSIVPSGTDIALSIGYKLNDKSIIGLGGSYNLGIGDIHHIRFSTQGMGLRSFIDWKLKKQFFVSGGFEMNYLTWERVRLQNYPSQQYSSTGIWQKSALIGIKKKLNITTKWFKSSDVQILYDLLSNQHIPVSQPVIFRTGYSF